MGNEKTGMMNHLEFVEKLEKKGISIRSTQVDGVPKRFETVDYGTKNTLIVKNGEVSFDRHTNQNPVNRLIKEAIDMDDWNHSWHTKIKPENYDKIQEIIQNKILRRADEIELLLTSYFQINREKSKENQKPE